MKKKLVILSLLLLIFLGAAWFFVVRLERDPNEPAIGDALADVGFLGADGKPVTIRSLQARGRPVLVFYRGKW